MSFKGRAWQHNGIQGTLESSLKLVDDVSHDAAALPRDRVIVEVISAALNPSDYKLPEAPIVGRIVVPHPATPGMDLCGRVVAKHPSVTQFAEGQIVFGGVVSSLYANGRGMLQKYTVLSAKGLAALPKGVEPDDAAAVGTAGTTAYMSLLPGKLQPGSKVFINGGSGGCGIWSVQIAKAMGHEVVTTCSTDKVDLCQQLGADEVIDYRKVDVIDFLKQKSHEFDLIVDNVGKDDGLYNISAKILKSGGTFAQVGVGSAIGLGTAGAVLKRNLTPSFLGAPNYLMIAMNNGVENLEPIGRWMAERKIKAVIDKTYAFEEVPQAYAYLREGHAKGKIVVHVGK